jgi:lipoprotein
MKVKLSIVFILIMLVVSGCGLGENFVGDLGDLKAPDTIPPLLEKEAKWSDLAGEMEAVSFLEKYPSYKNKGISRYYNPIIEVKNFADQGWMRHIEEISVKNGKETRKRIVSIEDAALVKDDVRIYDYGVYDHFLVWVEVRGDGSWQLKARNLETGETWLLDELSANFPSKVNVAPNDFGYSDGLLGYRCSIDQEQVGIKIYDLHHKTLNILAKRDDEKGKWFYSPSVSKDYIAWSLSTLGKDVEEYGEVFIYSRQSGQIQSLQSSRNFITPVVYGDYLVVREKPEGQNFIFTDKGYISATLWCYDLKNEKWCFSLSNQLKPYQGKNIATLHAPRAFYQNLFVYDLEPETEPLVIVDAAKACYYVVPKDKVSGKTYHFLRFADGFIYVTLDDKVYRAKLK